MLFKELDYRDIESILKITDETYKIISPQFFIKPEKDILSFCVNNGLSWGAFYENKLIGFALALIIDENNNKFSYMPELKNSYVQYVGILVKPEYQNSDVAKTLSNHRFSKVSQMNLNIIAIAHPLNNKSLHLLKMQGFTVKNNRNSYKGYERLFLIRECI